MCTIAGMDDLGKRFEGFMVPALVALVGLACFGLGRLSVTQTEGARLVINAPTTQVAAVANVPVKAGAAPAQAAPRQAGTYVASKSGSKYYLPTCSGANRIKEENKVWFDSASAAEAAGYGKAANCPGL